MFAIGDGLSNCEFGQDRCFFDEPANLGVSGFRARVGIYLLQPVEVVPASSLDREIRDFPRESAYDTVLVDIGSATSRFDPAKLPTSSLGGTGHAFIRVVHGAASLLLRPRLLSGTLGEKEGTALVADRSRSIYRVVTHRRRNLRPSGPRG